LSSPLLQPPPGCLPRSLPPGGEPNRRPIPAIDRSDTLGPAVFDDDVLVFDGPGLRQALAEGCDETRVFPGRRAIEEPDHRQRVLLRVRREWPRRRRAAEQRDELASLHHSITSSARCWRNKGTSMPSAFAVLRLITSSNLVGN